MFQHDIFAIFLLATTLYNLILICALCKWRKRSFADWLCWFVFGVCWRWQIYDLEMVEMLLKNIKYIMTWNMIAFLHFFRPFFKSDLFIVNKMLFYLNFSELTFAEQKTNLPSVIGNMCSLKATCVFISKKKTNCANLLLIFFESDERISTSMFLIGEICFLLVGISLMPFRILIVKYCRKWFDNSITLISIDVILLRLNYICLHIRTWVRIYVCQN